MRLKTVNRVLQTLLIFSFGFYAKNASAAIIIQAKENKVLIDNEFEPIKMGYEYVIKDINNKKVGVIKISQVKENRSIGHIIEGKSKGTERVDVSTARTTTQRNKSKALNANDDIPDKVTDDDAVEKNSDEEQPIRWRAKKISILGILNINTMTAKETNGLPPTPQIEDVGMKGFSFGLIGALDIPWKPWFDFRLVGGYEPFTVAGNAAINGCDNATSTNCNANINYLMAGAYAKFNRRIKRAQIWGGFGESMKFPISKSSTALRTEDIKLTGSFGVTAGLDYFYSHKSFFSVSIEQEFYFNSDTVKANSTSLRAGLGWTR